MNTAARFYATDRGRDGVEVIEPAVFTRSELVVRERSNVAGFSLADVYSSWLDLLHPHKNGLWNRDRSKPDLLNHRRALQCFAVGARQTWDDLGKVPVKALEVNEALLVEYVGIGARKLAGRKGKVVSKKTIANLVSCVKTIRATVFRSYGRPEAGPRAQQLLDNLPKRRNRRGFSLHLWPERLKQEWIGYRTWKLKPVLTPAEGSEYRRDVCRPISIDKKQSMSLNAYIGYLVRERSMIDLNLLELCDSQLFSDFLDWYFALDADGGYTAASHAATTLATVSQYLVAKGLLTLLVHGEKPWDTFYGFRHSILRLGANRGQIAERADVGFWKPEDLRKVGREAWNTDPVYRQAPCNAYHKFAIFNRRRSGLFFFLAGETPLRARNWLEMKWHKQLVRLDDGRWHVRFKGDELKVGRRGYKTNVYEHTYSVEASQMIDRWRLFLLSAVCEDFEQRSPYVFIPCNPGKAQCGQQLNAGAFARGIKLLSLELRGENFNPHKVRHIVGSYLVNEYGAKGLGLAARLLGDTPNVVLKSYYRPSTERDLDDYFSTLNS